MQTLSEIAEEAARTHFLSKVPKRNIAVLDIVIETFGSKPVMVSVNIDFALSPLLKNYDTKKITEEATEIALEAVEQYLRTLSCRFKT